jgi:hypothetical protein
MFQQLNLSYSDEQEIGQAVESVLTRSSDGYTIGDEDVKSMINTIRRRAEGRVSSSLSGRSLIVRGKRFNDSYGHSLYTSVVTWTQAQKDAANPGRNQNKETGGATKANKDNERKKEIKRRSRESDDFDIIDF